MKLKEVDPAFEQLSSLHLVAPKADPSESAEGGPVSLRNSADEFLEIAVPGHHYRRETVPDRSDNRIGCTGGEKVTHETDIVAP